MIIEFSCLFQANALNVQFIENCFTFSNSWNKYFQAVIAYCMNANVCIAFTERFNLGII